MSKKNNLYSIQITPWSLHNDVSFKDRSAGPDEPMAYGPGEKKYAKEKDAKLAKKNKKGYDIITFDGKKEELKAIKSIGLISINAGASGRQATHVVKYEIEGTNIKLSRICSQFSEEDFLIIEKMHPGATLYIKRFLNVTYPKIAQGEISPTAIGNIDNKKWSSLKGMLLLMCDINNLLSLNLSNSIPLDIDSINEFCLLLSKCSVKECFKEADGGLVLVTEFGYCHFKYEELDEVFEVVSISRGSPKIKLKKGCEWLKINGKLLL